MHGSSVLSVFVEKQFLSCSCRSTDTHTYTHTHNPSPPLEFLRHPYRLHNMVFYLIALEYHKIKRLMQPVTFQWKSERLVIGRLRSGRPIDAVDGSILIAGSVTFAPASRWWPCRWNRQTPVDSRHSWSWHPALVPRDLVTCSRWPWCSVRRRRSRRRHPRCQSLCPREKYPKIKKLNVKRNYMDNYWHQYLGSLH